jgi:hypothetical protein
MCNGKLRASAADTRAEETDNVYLNRNKFIPQLKPPPCSQNKLTIVRIWGKINMIRGKLFEQFNG